MLDLSTKLELVHRAFETSPEKVAVEYGMSGKEVSALCEAYRPLMDAWRDAALERVRHILLDAGIAYAKHLSDPEVIEKTTAKDAMGILDQMLRTLDPSLKRNAVEGNGGGGPVQIQVFTNVPRPGIIRDQLGYMPDGSVEIEGHVVQDEPDGPGHSENGHYKEGMEDKE
jgi:hypothetical protein